MSKAIAKGSSDGSSRGLQALINYHLKEKGPYMSADELLKTQKAAITEGVFTGLQKTDIIQFKTDSFDHWGMYYGLNCVVHLTEDGFIRQAQLTKVANGKQCRINNKVKSAERRELIALPPEQIMKTVEQQLNKQVKNSALQHNSEHKVTEWKYGVAFSDTVDVLVKDVGRMTGAVVVTAGATVLTGPGGLAAAPFGYKVGEKLAEGVSYALTRNAGNS